MDRVEENIPLVFYLAKKYKDITSYEYEDLVQVGCLGLMRADKYYEEDKGIRFSTYAGRSIANEILRFIKAEKWKYDNDDGFKASPCSILNEKGDNYIDTFAYADDISDSSIDNIMCNDLLKDLTRIERENIVCRYFEDMTFQQIANIRGVTNEAIRVNINKALNKLRKGCEERWK